MSFDLDLAAELRMGSEHVQQDDGYIVEHVAQLVMIASFLKQELIKLHQTLLSWL